MSTTQIGGVAANVALWLSRHECVPYFFGASGRTQNGARKILEEQGITTAFVEKNIPNPSYTAVIDKNGELIIGAAEMECYEAVLADDIVPLLPEKPQTVIIDANFPLETLWAISKSLPEKTNLYAVGTSVEKVSRLLPLLNRVDVLVLNKAEACSLISRDNDVSTLATKILNKLQRHSAIALVSDGANEAALASENYVIRRNPPKIRLSNANGAGDAMAASLFMSCHENADEAKKPSEKRNKLEMMFEGALTSGANYAEGRG
jgi:pseudouridine kinase